MDNFGNIFFDKFEIVIKKKWNIYLFLLEKKEFLFLFEVILI